MPARDPGRCRLADVVDEISEKPSRFLAFAPVLALPRFQTDDRVDTVQELIHLELGDEDGSERQQSVIVGALNRRIQELQEYSEPDANIQKRREIDPMGGRTRYLIWRNGTWHQSDQPNHGAIVTDINN